ncbi:MAG: NADPH-dependent glutamate synthase [Planctomycetota bacterium]|jgi:glutamate synthase (NADPH/NADH) small chain|nr:NADPH-dependent glutamate synthase [Planctomycetota bacterium]MDP6941598.1 NADPH-dependent glutamate synthase [Planctomycetota bacterium]
MTDKPKKKKRLLNKSKVKTPMQEQDPSKRIYNYEEVPLGYSPEEAVSEAQRCIQCKDKPCIDGCPVGIDIPAFMLKLAANDLEGAFRKIKEKNFLPAICGRVCPQEDQCELICTLNKPDKGRESSAIGRVERFIGDYALQNDIHIVPEIAPATRKTVAVIGSGPAGLTCASDMIQLGHEVTVFEALHKPGGVLFYGIPEFRLPKAVLMREVDGLKEMGVKFVMNYPVGKAESLDSIRERFDATFIGTGAGLPWFLNIPGENLNGVYSANEFLTRVNLMGGYKFPHGADTPVKKIKSIAIIGAGNTAMDSSRTARRMGIENVNLVYRRSRLEMPARQEEIHHAEEEGVNFYLLHSPLEFLGDDKGCLRAMRVQEMELGEPDDSGRRRPVPIEGHVKEIEVDTAVISIGQGPNPLLIQDCPELKLHERKGTILADETTFQTSYPDVFAGGDIVTGGATVILAMGAGRQAAEAMHRYLMTGNAMPTEVSTPQPA